MKHITFEKLRLKNIRCHSDIEIDFPVGKLTCIVGKNGHGKSTIPKAIAVALYGDDGDGNKIADMVYKKVGKNSEILFNFSVDADKFEIRLYQNHSRYQSKMFLFRNEIDISGKTKTETYEIIEKLLVPKKIYFNSIYFAQQVKDFFTCLANMEQKSIFNSVLSLEEYEIYHDNTSKKIVEVEEYAERDSKLLLAFESEIPAKETHYKSLASNIKEKKETNKRSIEEKKEKIKDLTNQVKDLQKLIDKSSFNQDHLNGLISKISEVKTRLDSLDSEFVKFRATEMIDLQKKVEQIKGVATNKFNEDKASLVAFLDTMKQVMNRRIQELLNDINKITEKYSNNSIESQLRELSQKKQKKLEELHLEYSKISKKFNIEGLQKELDQKIKDLTEEKNNFKSEAESIKNKALIKASDIEKLKKEIEEDQKCLNEESATCTKCKQKLNEEHKQEVIKDIEKNSNQIKLLKSEYDEIKKLFEEAKLKYQKKTEEINVISAENIRIVTSKKEEKESEEKKLDENKKTIENEYSEKESELEKSKLELKEKEKDEKHIKDMEKLDLERQITVQEEKLKKDVEDLKTKITKICNVNIQEATSGRELCIRQEKERIEVVKIELSEKITNLETKKTELEKQKTDLDELLVKVICIKNNMAAFNVDIKKLEYEKINEDELIELEKDIQKAKENKHKLMDQLNICKNELEILNFWKEAFSDKGIKSMLIDSSIPYMNRVVREELEKLAPGQFIVSFDTLTQTKSGDVRDRFNVNILNCVTGADNHKLLSGGEKRLIDVCCMKALRSLVENFYQKKFNVTFYDEVLDSLDDDNSSAFCKLIKLACKDQHIQIITHTLVENIDADIVLRL